MLAGGKVIDDTTTTIKAENFFSKPFNASRVISRGPKQVAFPDLSTLRADTPLNEPAK